MTLDLQTLRNKVRRATGQDSDDLTDTECDLLLNQTYWEIQEKFHLRETESSTTFLTVVGQREYELPPSFESLRISSIIDNDSGKHSELTRMSIKEYENEYSSDSETRAKPTKYFRAANSIILFATPDDVYAIVIHYRTKLDDLSDDNIDPQLPNSWKEMLYVGATARAFFENGDFENEKKVNAKYVQLINSAIPVEAKEEGDSSKAGVQPLGNEY